MVVKLEMEATPSDDQVNNIIADLTRVFVIEWRHQTEKVSGVAVVDELTETIKWDLTKAVMVKLMKIHHMYFFTKATLITTEWAVELYLTDQSYDVFLNENGVLEELNTLFLRGGNTAAADSKVMDGMERNWEPGKVLPKNEIHIADWLVGGAEAHDAVMTSIVHIHYQLFKFRF